MVQDGDFWYGEKYDYDPCGRLRQQTNYFNVTQLDSALVKGRWEFSLVGTEKTIHYTYNQADQVTSVTYPDGSVITYDYDQLGRLRKVGSPADNDKYAAMTYTDRSELNHLVLGHNAIQTVDYTYNARGWLNQINNPESLGSDKFGEQLYYYGKSGDDSISTDQRNGNVAGIDLAATGSAITESYAYQYDDLDRLTAMNRKDYDDWYGCETFAYDLNGNRSSYSYRPAELTSSVTYTSYYSPLSNQVDSVRRTGQATQKLTYDGDGNWAVMQNQPGGFAYKSFSYDILNQLKRVTFDNVGYPDNTLSFGYNASGERVYKDYRYFWQTQCPPDTVDTGIVELGIIGGFEEELGSASTGIVIEGIIGGFEEGLTGASALSSVVNPGLCTHSDTVQTYYLVSQGKVLAEYMNLASGPSFTYIYAGDQRIGMRDSQNKLHFYLADHLGSTRVVFDSAGVVKDLYRYLAFGAPETGQTIATNQPNRYTG